MTADTLQKHGVKAFAIRLEAIASRLEASLVGWRPGCTFEKHDELIRVPFKSVAHAARVAEAEAHILIWRG